MSTVTVSPEDRLGAPTQQLRAGKVLSKKNTGRLTSAIKSLHAILSNAGGDPMALITGTDGTQGGSPAGEGAPPGLPDGTGVRSLPFERVEPTMDAKLAGERRRKMVRFLVLREGLSKREARALIQGSRGWPELRNRLTERRYAVEAERRWA